MKRDAFDGFLAFNRIFLCSLMNFFQLEHKPLLSINFYGIPSISLIITYDHAKLSVMHTKFFSLCFVLGVKAIDGSATLLQMLALLWIILLQTCKD